ncbi:putative nucleotidyltransferase with HDIG domain [Methylobacterium brachiatum]|uniref:Nucleotidyltransferase with HDIG domain n=1 Tax=Methylobacterium brachiatum TaxID=269660 RepID=A0AAJ1TTW2_9HYPH|nr:HD domain-containing phosphohydrolase [Methylobacterium brachiatum]MCB4802646.1 HD domain-containing protein [Methylobacterium brachiatum]MDQ0543272.1 putative nucleotidyltransferase with HDIG domain [Methylobacterium brachiatum]
MQPNIVILTDRHDRGLDLADAVRSVAQSRLLLAGNPWTDVDTIKGVIVVASLDRSDTKQCLKDLHYHLSGRRIPIIYLLRSRHGSDLYEAGKHGVTACLSSLTEPTKVVAALFRQVAPDKTLTDLLVEHSAARIGTLFSKMMAGAKTGAVDLPAIDAEIDPVLQVLREGGLRRWINKVQAHDDMTVRHCLLVAGVVANFAISLRLSVEDRTTLVRAALLHDVGKAQIPVAILNKPEHLDPAEMAVMRTHAALGYDILRTSGMSDPLTLLGVRHHHEMLDGTGYPDGLRGAEISDAVRLLTICDIYSALTEHRPYRPAMPQVEALKILRKMTPLKLESALVEAFAASLVDADQLCGRPCIDEAHEIKSASTVPFHGA